MIALAEVAKNIKIVMENLLLMTNIVNMIEQECAISSDQISNYVKRMLSKRLKIVHIGFSIVSIIFIFMSLLSKSLLFFVLGAIILGFVYIYIRAGFTYEIQKIGKGLRIVISNSSVRKFIENESLQSIKQSKRTQTAYSYTQEIPFSDITSITIKESEIIIFTKQANTQNEYGRITIPCEIESFENISDYFNSNPDKFPRINRK